MGADGLKGTKPKNTRSGENGYQYMEIKPPPRALERILVSNTEISRLEREQQQLVAKMLKEGVTHEGVARYMSTVDQLIHALTQRRVLSGVKTHLYSHLSN